MNPFALCEASLANSCFLTPFPLRSCNSLSSCGKEGLHLLTTWPGSFSQGYPLPPHRPHMPLGKEGVSLKSSWARSIFMPHSTGKHVHYSLGFISIFTSNTLSLISSPLRTHAFVCIPPLEGKATHIK